jgi:hypothetical protein
LSGLKSVPCALLFAALIKIGFVLFKMKYEFKLILKGDKTQGKYFGFVVSV